VFNSVNLYVDSFLHIHAIEISLLISRSISVLN